jgi:hypothetical protein
MKSSMGNRKILLGLTTTPGSDWRAKVEEIDKLGLKEIALFPTCLGPDDRKELYALLEKTGIENIPHVHLRDDMESWEIDLFIEKYSANVFNIHPNHKGFELIKNNAKYRSLIYIENLYTPPAKEYFKEEIFVENKLAGICGDLSHLKAEQLLYPDLYSETINLFEKYPIGCNHISAVTAEPYLWKNGAMIQDSHFLSNQKELDYIKEFPGKYFSDFVSIELENSFKEQLEAKKYIESIINSKK